MLITTPVLCCFVKALGLCVCVCGLYQSQVLLTLFEYILVFFGLT